MHLHTDICGTIFYIYIHRMTFYQIYICRVFCNLLSTSNIELYLYKYLLQYGDQTILVYICIQILYMCVCTCVCVCIYLYLYIEIYIAVSSLYMWVLHPWIQPTVDQKYSKSKIKTIKQ